MALSFVESLFSAYIVHPQALSAFVPSFINPCCLHRVLFDVCPIKLADISRIIIIAIVIWMRLSLVLVVRYAS